MSRPLNFAKQGSQVEVGRLNKRWKWLICLTHAQDTQKKGLCFDPETPRQIETQYSKRLGYNSLIHPKFPGFGSTTVDFSWRSPSLGAICIPVPGSGKLRFLASSHGSLDVRGRTSGNSSAAKLEVPPFKELIPRRAPRSPRWSRWGRHSERRPDVGMSQSGPRELCALHGDCRFNRADRGKLTANRRTCTPGNTHTHTDGHKHKHKHTLLIFVQGICVLMVSCAGDLRSCYGLP